MLDGVIPPLLVIVVALVLVGLRRLYPNGTGRRAVLADAAVIIAIVCFAALMEIEMGRTPTYRHGRVRLWSGDVRSDQNSQQVFDPYAFTHMIHGAAFYGLTWIALGPTSLGLRAIVGTTLESAWEVYENTDSVINRYRAATISLGYYGDSLVNSVGDILACVVGFLLARRLPALLTVAWVVAIEVILVVWVRDNLTLNIVMLLYPISAIRTWQMGP